MTLTHEATDIRAADDTLIYIVISFFCYNFVWPFKCIKIFISCNENINVNKKKVDPDLIFFTAQRSENISFIFSLVKI